MGEDRELIEMFIEETRERLEAIEPALVELERAESAAEKERLLNDVFRHLHSTKGSAGYLNLTDLVALRPNSWPTSCARARQLSPSTSTSCSRLSR